MALFTQRTFKVGKVHSLCWRGDELVDWLGGGRSFSLDGSDRQPSMPIVYGYRFDAAIASRDGRFAVIFERLGTKGLLLKDGRSLRELNRSYYQADVYEYPIALFHEPGGRLLLAHCPEEYCRIEIEQAETGATLTALVERTPNDFFHSRLAASPTGKRLLSAGWVWHPLSEVVHFDIACALSNPSHLDRGEHMPYSSKVSDAEEASACWLDDNRIVVAGSNEVENPQQVQGVLANCLLPRGLAIYDIDSHACLRAFQLTEAAGTIIGIGANHILSLYRHPKLIDLATGEVVHVWTELHSGLQDGSIVWHLEGESVPPPMAFDTDGCRFAIHNGEALTVIEFDRLTLGAL